MVVRPMRLRACATMLFSALLLLTGMACGKSASEKAAAATTFDISGTVKYGRVPVHYDASGVPTGLETDASLITSSAARGLQVKVYQLKSQFDADYKEVKVWTLVGSANTGSEGKFYIPGLAKKGFETFVEVTSVAVQAVSPASTINLIADPKGVYSDAQITDRPIYVIRKALDGTTSDTDPVHSSMGNATATVDFTIGQDDKWMVVHPKWNSHPVAETYPMPEQVAAGSRILAILDSCYAFGQVYGNCVPDTSTVVMDLHYRPGVTVRRGTFVEYNRNLLPLSWDGSSYHFFGSIAGGGTLDGVVQQDDAFNSNVLYQLMGRNHMFGQGSTAMFPAGVPTTSLAPDLALVEGFGDAMAAGMCRSPYLCGTTPATRFSEIRDIRDLSAFSAAQVTPFSAPAITAMCWDMMLINTAITAPGDFTAWKTINPVNLVRFYSMLAPTATSGTATVVTDCPSLFTQMARLQEDKASTDNSDLKTFFTDSVLTSLGAKYHFTWVSKADAILPRYTQTWGIDPDTRVTPFPTLAMTMAGATKIKRYQLSSGVETVVDAYPNNSFDEVRYARFALTTDRSYILRVTTVPALPQGAQIEVRFNGDSQQVYLFPKNDAVELSLLGHPADLSTPKWNLVRVRILSPDVQVLGTQVTIHLEKKN